MRTGFSERDVSVWGILSCPYLPRARMRDSPEICKGFIGTTRELRGNQGLDFKSIQRSK
jgi:hypothetical protein